MVESPVKSKRFPPRTRGEKENAPAEAGASNGSDGRCVYCASKDCSSTGTVVPVTHIPRSKGWAVNAVPSHW